MAAKLVSMKQTKKEIEEKYSTKPADVDAPIYPYGLQVRLGEDELEKLGLSKLPEAGSELVLVARVVVTGSSVNTHANGSGQTHKHKSLELQITDLCLEDESGDDEKTAAALYNGDHAEA